MRDTLLSKKDAPANKWFYISAIILLFPALLINLGVLTFIDDEGIRSLVALEMKLSGNYITPTLNGEFYYNKPPLYNWILLVFFQLFGAVNEWTARIPTVVALMGYAATVYYFFRKHYDRETAFINAFLLITCGRILFWDSMLGLIDTCFSWVTFTSFMMVFHHYEKRNYWALFLTTYLLTAIGFLMKGLPSIVFQGITLITFFIYQKEFKKLFSIQHIVSGLMCVALIASYYLVYHQYNDLEVVFRTLFTESSSRTVVKFGIWETILHFFTFPFEMVYHFLPWSLMIIYFLRKDLFSLLRKDHFIFFNLLIFLANVLIYWTSPQVYPRYLLMMIPLIFSSYIYLHKIHKAERTWQFIFIDRLFLIVCPLIGVLSLAPLFLERTQDVSFLIVKTLTWSIGLLFASFLYYRFPSKRLLSLIIFLLIFRIGFNWFVIPDRNGEDYGNVCRQTSIEAAKILPNKKMYVYRYTVMQPTNAFYTTVTRQEIIPRKLNNFDLDAVYIIDPVKYPEVVYEKLGEFHVRHGRKIYDVGILK
ncbi:MAG: glycosyltransferase family 39 protein [Saprospiraceae bacterium]|nr:glycosyltransferase family 39 protein [Saprospiraceae bacterium]